MAMFLRSRIGSVAVMAVLVAGATLVVWPSTSNGSRAEAATGTSGQISFAVSPTVGLVDGQTVAVHAEAPEGVAIYELRVRLCRPNGPYRVRSTYDFSDEGERCPTVALGSGDQETAVAYPTGTAVGDIEFRVGSGSLEWENSIGRRNVITCGPGAPCPLVVQAQITNGQAFYNVELCYGDGCPAEPGAPAPPPEPPAPAASEMPSGEAAAPVDASGSSDGTSGTSGAGTSAAAPSGSNAADASSTTPAAASTNERQALSGATPASISVPSELLSRRQRVFLAAILGALGCARIVYVVRRTRARALAGAL